MGSILRKYPTRFANIQYGGSKTIGRSGLAKKIRKLRTMSAEFSKKHPGSKMLSPLGHQRLEIKSKIKAAVKRKIGTRGDKHL